MKRRLAQILICQIAAAAICFSYIRIVRTDYRDALIRQGEEIGRMRTVERLLEAGAEIPDDLRGADKAALVSPGISEFAHTWIFIAPAAVLQGVAIFLAALAHREPRQKDGRPKGETQEAEQGV